MARILKLEKNILLTKVLDFIVNVKTDEIYIINVIDTGVDVDATIGFAAGPGDNYTLKLWNEEEYANAGNWSDADVDERIKKILEV